MRKITLLVALISMITFTSSAQSSKTSNQSTKSSKSKIGIKVGYNYSNVIGSSTTFNPQHNDGYMISVFLASASRNGIGYRSELVYSKQGYSFDNGGKNTEIKSDYLYMPHLMTFTIAKIVQIQAGGQIGVLLNAKASGTKDTSITGLMNRFDYGFAGGVEVYPIKGLIIGTRYNLGLGKVYKSYGASSSTPYPLRFDPSAVNLKNGVLQFFIGYRF
jgi:hypothetical protein